MAEAPATHNKLTARCLYVYSSHSQHRRAYAFEATVYCVYLFQFSNNVLEVSKRTRLFFASFGSCSGTRLPLFRHHFLLLHCADENGVIRMAATAVREQEEKKNTQTRAKTKQSPQCQHGTKRPNTFDEFLTTFLSPFGICIVSSCCYLRFVCFCL